MTGPSDDFYEALGVPRDATAAAIKTAYRKLVLKHHPDKVADDADKTAAADRFHKIQTAWEAVGDEDKRQKYDALCRLAALKKERAEAERSRYPSGDYARPDMFRTTTDYRQPNMSMPRPPMRQSATYRVVEPDVPFNNYSFDSRRQSERRDFDYDRDDRRRTPPKEDPRRPKLARQLSKESERARRHEGERRRTKDNMRDRDMKNAYRGVEVESDSDDGGYFGRAPKRDHYEEERFMMAARKAEQERTRKLEQERSDQLMPENVRRDLAAAQDYQRRLRENKGSSDARRPSPTRMSSSRENLDYITRTADGRHAQVRRTSHKPTRTSSRDDEDIRPARRGSDRDVPRSSGEYEEHIRRPPATPQSKSAPHDIKIPDKQRSNSVQYTSMGGADFMPSAVKRADTMPNQAGKERSKPQKSSTLRNTQTATDYQRRSPERDRYAPLSRSPQDYSDERDSPIRGHYATEVRAPGRRATRSPSPDLNPRSASARYGAPPPLSRTTSTSYQYPSGSMPMRPKLARDESGSGRLYGEIPTTRRSVDRDPNSPSSARNARIEEIRPSRGDGRSSSYYRSPGVAAA